jgi:FkbM family methyltransferase
MIEELDTRYGKMFVPDTDNGQYGWLKSIGASPEDEQIEMICALLDERPRGYALDCGANFGCWSLPLARHAAGVIAFEPQRCVFELLHRTIAANPDLKILARNIALGPERGTIKVPDVNLDDTTNFGGVSLGIPHSEHPDAPMYDIDVYRLDDVAPALAHVSFIKADVEGAELGLFQGAVRTIERCRPIIIAEADHPLTDTQALGAFIESLGYNVEIAQDNNFIGMPI